MHLLVLTFIASYLYLWITSTTYRNIIYEYLPEGSAVSCLMKIGSLGSEPGTLFSFEGRPGDRLSLPGDRLSRPGDRRSLTGDRSRDLSLDRSRDLPLDCKICKVDTKELSSIHISTIF